MQYVHVIRTRLWSLVYYQKTLSVDFFKELEGQMLN